MWMEEVLSLLLYVPLAVPMLLLFIYAWRGERRPEERQIEE